MNLLPLPLSSLVVAVAAAASFLPAQYGPYTSESFEGHRYSVGNLAGTDLWNGQDGWILFDSLAYPGNLAAARVQTQNVRSGLQAVTFDAALLSPGAFGELRRNALFSLTTGVIEAEWDFLITSATNPSGAWEFYTQPAPHPQSCQMRWWIAANGRVEFYDTPARVLVQTSHYVSKDAWHHARSVVDIFGNRTEVHVDGVLVAVGTPIGVFANLPDHGFSQFNCWNAGNDRMHVDNFQVRERTAEHGLSVAPDRLPVNRRTVATFRLAGGASLANRTYALCGSMAGTQPGTPIGNVTLPLVVDGFFWLVVGALGTPSLPGFLGTCNPDGNAEAVFDTTVLVPPQLLGFHLDFAYLTMNPIDEVSEPVRLTVTLN
ncbi:MAG: hypothetical protein JNK15_12480 [Planctomycetes bacterium]|nr:hypothetical protein [Planctomycetota bacterium]